MGDSLFPQCVVARQRVSLRLDGELPEAEEELLDGHLASCPDCQAWAAAVGDVVSLVRSEPLVQPSRDLRMPPQRLFGRAVVPAAAAVVAGLAIAALSIQAQSTSLFTIRLSAVTLRTQLTLKEQQQTALDNPGSRPQDVRPSLPPGVNGD